MRRSGKDYDMIRRFLLEQEDDEPTEDIATDEPEGEAEEESEEIPEDDSEDDSEDEQPSEEDSPIGDSVLDTEIQSVLIDFESTALKTKSDLPEEKNESMICRSGISLLLEEDAPEFEEKIDMSVFASEVARLVKNYDNLLDMESLLVSKATDFIEKKYGPEAVDALTKNLSDVHDIEIIEPKKLDSEQQVPIAIGASAEAAASG